MNDVNKNDFLKHVINGEEPQSTNFYNTYDNLIWGLCVKWFPVINKLSKNQIGKEDLHNELWMHVFKNLNKYNSSRSNIATWIHIICTSKLGMIKRSLEAQKNRIFENEINYSHSAIKENSVELIEFINDKKEPFENKVASKEEILDFVYLILDLFDGCTDKERKIYLLKIKGKNQNEIALEANVSKSYIPKAFKKMGQKLKRMYNSMEETFISKEERNALANDLLNRKPNLYISKKYDIEIDTVKICKEMLDVIGIRN